MTTSNSNNEVLLLTIAVLGGTGKEGSGLALRWANSGYRVIIGSRDADRAQKKADELNTQLGDTYISGLGNYEAAKEADVVVLSVPYSAHKSTLEAIRDAVQDKVLIDVTVPLQPPNVRQVYIPDGKSAALEAQEFLGENVRVVAAFQNASAVHLMNLEHKIDCDILVCGDSSGAKQDAIRLVEAAGMRGIDAGLLVNAIAVESLTPVILHINKQYKVKAVGIRITGIE